MTYGDHGVSHVLRMDSRDLAAYLGGFVADTSGVLANIHDLITDIYEYSLHKWLFKVA